MRAKRYIYNGLFTTLTTISAYWLGLIAADGTIGRLKCKSGNYSHYFSICLKEEDGYLIERLKKDLSLENKIVIRTIGDKKYWQVGAGNIDLYQDLLKLGIYENKTHTLDASVIPDDLFFYDFLRGVIDGDGSVQFYKIKTHYKAQVTICGTEMFLEGLKERIGTGSLFKIKGSSAYIYAICAQRQLLDMYRKMYENTDLYMKRKRLVFDKIYNYIIRDTIPYVGKHKNVKKIVCVRCGKTKLIHINAEERYCSKGCFYQRNIPYEIVVS